MIEEQRRHPREGERVRLRLNGSRGSYTVEGRLLALSHKGVDLTLASTGRTIQIPSNSIATLHLVGKDGSWQKEALPPRLEDILEPLRRLFTDSTGKFRKQLSEAALSNLIDASRAAEAKLFDPSLRGSAQHLVQALVYFQTARNAHGYEPTEAAKRAFLASITAGRNSIPTTYPHDLDLLSDAFTGAEILMSEFWRTFVALLDPKPRFISTPKPAKVALERGGELSLPLRIKLDSNTAPATAVSVLMAPGDDVEYLASPPSFERLTPGSIETVRHPAILNGKEERRPAAGHP